jgi:Fe-Mn family superoxide dismutase
MAKKDKLTHDQLMKSLRESLGLAQRDPSNSKKNTDILQEAYVVETKVYDLATEMLSAKNKKAHQQVLEGYVETVNKVSAKLDGANREEANSNDSEFRSLKIDETYNLNAAFLTGMFFENISDMKSQITMDSLTYMRLERDFGTFDEWQNDFIACCLSSRDGWAMTVYNAFLNRYVNVVVDLHSTNVPINCYPVVVMDMSPASYYRDYLNDKKTYIFAMMKEFQWDTIEDRIRRAERISKVMKG